MPPIGGSKRKRGGWRELFTESSMSYEDVEGLVVTVGVTAALMISFSIGLAYIAVPEEFQRVNFEQMMCSNPSFRKFVLHTMEGSINFTPDMGDEGTLDIRGVLASDLGEFDHGKCMEGKVAASIAFIASDFPMKFFEAWLKLHPDDEPSSSGVAFMSHLSTICLFLTVTMSTAAYVSLGVSPAREDQSGEAMNQWLRASRPALVYVFVLLFLGMLFFFIANDTYLRLKINHKKWSGTRDLGLDLFFAFGAVIGLSLVGVGNVFGRRAYVEAHRSEEDSQAPLTNPVSIPLGKKSSARE